MLKKRKTILKSHKKIYDFFPTANGTAHKKQQQLAYTTATLRLRAQIACNKKIGSKSEQKKGKIFRDCRCNAHSTVISNK